MTHSVIKLSGSVNESFRNRNKASVGDELRRRCEGNDTGGGLGGTLWMFTATGPGLAALLVHFPLAFGPPKAFFVSLFPSLSSSTASLAIFGFSQSTPTFPLSAFLPPAGILMFCDSEQGVQETNTARSNYLLPSNLRYPPVLRSGLTPVDPCERKYQTFIQQHLN